MSEPTSPSQPPLTAQAPVVARCPAPRALRLGLPALLLLALLLGGWNAWRTANLQQQLGARLHGADAGSAEAATLARQALDANRELAARVAVLEAHEQDLSVQRQALQQLVQDLGRSRDDALLGQIGTGIAAAQQQAELSGDLTPLLAALNGAASRLQHNPGPRAAQLLRAVQADQQRLRASPSADLPTTAARLGQIDLLVDQLQTLGSAQRPAAVGSHAHAVEKAAPGWRGTVQAWTDAAWSQFSQLISVTRIDQPDAMLASPQQDAYLRQNLKLHLLSAHLDLLARNASAYQADLRAVVDSLQRMFNPQQSQVQQALILARQAAQIDLTAHPASQLQSTAALASLGLGGQ